MTEDVNMVVRRAPGLPSQAVFDYSATSVGATQEQLTFYTGSKPVALEPGLWYIGVYAASTNVSVRNISFNITACASGGDVTRLVNNIQVDKTNTLDVPQFFYIDITKPSLSLEYRVQPFTGPVDVYLAYDRIPTKDDFDLSSRRPGLSREDFLVLNTGTPPLQLVEGRWWIAVYPTGNLPMTYSVFARVIPDDGEAVGLLPGSLYEQAPVNAPSTNYYRFTVPIGSGTKGVLFKAFDLTGDVDLYARLGTFPQQDFTYFSSENPGVVPEILILREGDSVLEGDWYVAIVTRGSVKTGYSLWAAYETDGILDSGIPIVATIQMPAIPGDPPNLTFSSTPDERYGVQYTDSLDFVDWLPLVEIVATGFQTTFPLPTVGVPETGRFYRVVQLQHP